ncbi:hypothetical protein B0H19DRAFT_1260987 [Mycena capillaripes]|nr:hypothetical protein B0H19DRAFT_1260987 [Mycena capillaripes]
MDGPPIDPTWSELGEQERMWASFQPFLEESEYILRHAIDWTSFFLMEWAPRSETAILNKGQVLDATRIADGAQAHILPVLDLLEDPKFETIAEVAEFVQQVLEGPVFLHSKNIAHRDICEQNIESSWMLPAWFPVDYVLRDDSDLFVINSRTQAGPIKYYFFDFDSAVHFPSYKARALVTGDCGRLREHIPEISDTIPYDPFKVDIHLVGEMLHKSFIRVCVSSLTVQDFEIRWIPGLDLVVPVIRKLRRRDPALRPEAAEALALFQLLRSKMSVEKCARVREVSPSDIEEE